MFPIFPIPPLPEEHSELCYNGTQNSVKYMQAYMELRHQNIKTVILEPTTKQRKRG
jgi:hypothetical protein